MNRLREKRRSKREAVHCSKPTVDAFCLSCLSHTTQTLTAQGFRLWDKRRDKLPFSCPLSLLLVPTPTGKQRTRKKCAFARCILLSVVRCLPRSTTRWTCCPPFDCVQHGGRTLGNPASNRPRSSPHPNACRPSKPIPNRSGTLPRQRYARGRGGSIVDQELHSHIHHPFEWTFP